MALPACGFYVAHASSEGVCGYSLLRVRTFEAASAHSQARDCALSAPRVRAHFSPPPHIPAEASAGAPVARIRFTVTRGAGRGSVHSFNYPQSHAAGSRQSAFRRQSSAFPAKPPSISVYILFTFSLQIIYIEVMTQLRNTQYVFSDQIRK